MLTGSQVDILIGAVCLSILVTSLLGVWFLIDTEEREEPYEGKRRKNGSMVRRALDWIRPKRAHRFLHRPTHALTNS